MDHFILRGKLRRLRERTAELTQLRPGESVLDVGCGTGTLALVIQPHVGPSGRVVGIDPGPQQIARARAKAARRHAPIDFQLGVIDHLDFPDASFDAVVSTLMMHHLPDDLRRQGLAEIARVLKPDGRLVIADFKPQQGHGSAASEPAARHAGVHDLAQMIKDAGFAHIETEEMPLPLMHGSDRIGFFVATK